MCLFCNIIKKEIPSYIIYEDDLCLAFLDISQVCQGHTLVVPKKHYNTMLDCDDETLMHIQSVAKMLGKRLITHFNALGMNVLTNINEVAGQSVMHYHLHLIPRYGSNDALEIKFNPSTKLNLEELHHELTKK